MSRALSRAVPIVVRPGGLQTAGSLALAGAAATIVSVSAWDDNQVAGRVAIMAVVVFSVGLMLGVARLVGLATMPFLGAALLASASVDGRDWVRSTVLGCLWYVAVELAWDAIERRRQDGRSAALDQRRAFEVAAVVVISISVSIAALAASALAPPRTIFVRAVVVAALAIGLGLTIRQLIATGRPATAGGEPAED